MLRPWIASTLVALALSISLIALPGAATARPATTVIEFPLEHPDSRPYTIVTGPDGNLWFTESDRGSIGRITPTGTVTEFDLPYANSGPYGITLGADGNLWFTERFANLIGKITPSGCDHGVLRSDRERPAVGHHCHAGWKLLVHRGERRPGRVDRPPGQRDGGPDRPGPGPDAHHHRPGRECLVHGRARQQHRPVRP